MVTKVIRVKDSITVHPNTAAQIVQKASGYQSSISLQNKKCQCNAKSLMGVFSFDLSPGMSLEVCADGSDEKSALLDLENFLSK